MLNDNVYQTLLVCTSTIASIVIAHSSEVTAGTAVIQLLRNTVHTAQ